VWFNYYFWKDLIPIYKATVPYTVNDEATKILKNPIEKQNLFSGRRDSIKNKLVDKLNTVPGYTVDDAWKAYAEKVHKDAHSYREVIDSGLYQIGLLSSDGNLTNYGYKYVNACALGDIGEALMKDDYQKAYKIAENFYEKFGEDYYLELQMHPKFEAQAKINEGIVTLNDELGIPTIVTSDSHFLNPEDANVRNIIEAIGYHKNIEDVYQSMESNSLGSPDRIKLWAEQSGFEHEDILKKSFKNTIDITNKCNAQLEEPQVRIPEFNRYEELDALFDEDWWC
jgi:hypothetical protein